MNPVFLSARRHRRRHGSCSRTDLPADDGLQRERAQLRQHGTVAVGGGGKRYRGGKAFVAIAADDHGRVTKAISLSGWTTFARPVEIPNAAGLKAVAAAPRSTPIPAIDPQQREALQNAAQTLHQHSRSECPRRLNRLTSTATELTHVSHPQHPCRSTRPGLKHPSYPFEEFRMSLSLSGCLFLVAAENPTVDEPSGFLGGLADAAEKFIGVFQAGGDEFMGLVTGIIPLLVVLLTAVNALIRLIGPERIDRLGEAPAARASSGTRSATWCCPCCRSSSSPTRWPTRWVGSCPRGSSRRSTTPPSASCTRSPALFPHANPGELFVYLGVATGVAGARPRHSATWPSATCWSAWSSSSSAASSPSSSRRA